MKHTKLFQVLAILVVLALLVSACGGAAPAEQPQEEAPAAEEAAPAAEGEMDFWAQAAEPYAGATIHGISESTPPSRIMRRRASISM